MKKKYDELKVLDSSRDYISDDRYTAIHMMSFGRDRRNALMKVIENSVNSVHGFVVNRKYCPLLKYDIDLVYLLKKGYLKRIRKGSFRTNNTYLILNPEKPYNE